MNKLFGLLNVSNLVCCLALSLISPFFPSFAEDRGVSKQMLGFIFAANPVGNTIASLIFGKLMNEHNRIKILNLGLIVNGFGLLGFAGLIYVDNSYIILTSFILRFLQGFGAAMFLTPFYALLASMYPNSLEKKMSIAEFISSFGYFSGPIFGSFLYGMGGFILPFLVFGFSSIVISLVLMVAFKLEHQNKQKLLLVNDSLENSTIASEEPEIGYKEIIKNYNINAGLLIYASISFLFTFYSPIYAPFIERKYNKSPDQIGYFLSVTSLTYSIATLIVSQIKRHKQAYILIGAFFSGVSQFFMGPDQMTNFNDSIWITLTAQGFVGFFTAFPFVLTLPYINEILQNLYPGQKERSVNLSAGLFNASIAFGELWGPICAGFLDNQYGFERACSILGIWIIISSLTFIPLQCKRKFSKRKYIIEEVVSN